ncbi:MAG: tol-pal system protein YbgF [Nitrospinae bacterium]|nr:tol-pal system protein YbgF [Nitrospinota bacterium]
MSRARRGRAALSVVVVVFLIAGVGCATPQTAKRDDDVESLKAQVGDLRKRVSELEMKSSSAEREILYLREKLEEKERKNGKSPAPQSKTGGDPVNRISAPNMFVGGVQWLVLAANPASEENMGDLGPEFRQLDEDGMYRESLRYLNEGRTARAIIGFSYLMRRYPSSPLAGPSQYWLGEALYGQKKYPQAAEEYRKAISRYPDSPRTPDAMLKLAYCLMKSGKDMEGVATLEELVAKFPQSVAAVTAKRKLAGIQQEKESSGDI